MIPGLRGYVANNLTVDGVAYVEVIVSFEEGKLSTVRWSLSVTDTRTIENFGNVEVTLPSLGK